MEQDAAVRLPWLTDSLRDALRNSRLIFQEDSERKEQLLTRAPNSVRAGLVTDTDISAAIYKESTGIIADGCVTRA